jgi:hypothetical protein
VGWHYEDYLQLASHVMRALVTAIDGDQSHALWFVCDDDVSHEVLAAASSFDTGQGVSREACQHDKGGPLAAVPKQTPAQGHWRGRSADGHARGKSRVVRRH